MSYAKPIRAEDTDAVEQLQARIAEAERLQERMKAANKIVRDKRLSDGEKIARLGTECRIPADGVQKLLRPDFAGRIGSANYELTNNGANIRRMQARVDALTKERTRASVIVEFPGGRVEDNAEECRVRIYHDEKPAREVIEKLKTNGFHWTPSLGCWQRMRNDSARWAAARVTGTAWPAPDAAESTGTTATVAPTVKTTPATVAPRVGMSA